ncbi:PLP-dependent transferase [Tothia fuscella]|uniref:PLP-dependent transferase n=1 Tax=Tothia fuscella TaxID=1048955 RepID=A0A9P4NXD3_9PEZI|nr:PLP-dependent transferase [Tothia fuscella]
MGTYNKNVELIRDTDYPQLKNSTYLDHAGTTIPAKSSLDSFARDMSTNIWGNPHSHSTPSREAGHRIDEVRLKLLHFFNASPEDYDIVFVANASAAIKLVGEIFRDYADGQSKGKKKNSSFWFGYHRDSHNSVVGVREFTNGNFRWFANDAEVDAWIQYPTGKSSHTQEISQANLAQTEPTKIDQLGLFAWPGQSNMTGRRLPLTWAKRIHDNNRNTYSLLDASALCTTSPLYIDLWQPDFTCLSFYKIFGFPNLGALIIKKTMKHLLKHRKYFAGGTVDMVIPETSGAWHAKRENIHELLEEGTVAFTSIFAVEHALNTHAILYGSMTDISLHTTYLTNYCYNAMHSLTHTNGTPVCIIYNELGTIWDDPKLQGGTIAFSVLRANGISVGYVEVEQAADAANVYIRSGSLCNPGGIAIYLGWTPQDLRSAYAAGHRCSKPLESTDGRPIGVVRVSFGSCTTKADIDALIAFLTKTYIEPHSRHDNFEIE